MSEHEAQTQEVVVPRGLLAPITCQNSDMNKLNDVKVHSSTIQYIVSHVSKHTFMAYQALLSPY